MQKPQSRVELALVAPDPAASGKREAAPRVDERASEKLKLVKEVPGQSAAKPNAARPELRKPSLLESMLAQFPASKQLKPGLQTLAEPPNVAGARKVDDKADAKVEDRNDKVEAKVKAGPGRRAANSSTKRKAKETLPRHAKKRQGLKGLQNFHRACYANSVIQCLNTIPELVSRLLRRSRGTFDNAKLRGITDAALLELQGNTRAVKDKKRSIRDIFRESGSKMYVL